MRCLEFAKRNFKEIFRDPISWIFMVALPVGLFVIMHLLVIAIGGDISYTPQFETKHLTVSMIIFAFSFLTIFSGNIISKDREDKFLLRLKSTPMKPVDFAFGYILAVVPYAFLQEVLIVITGIILGLKLSINTILMILALFPFSFLFIAFGVLFGSIFGSKAVGGISSIIPQASSILGGMFFPLSLIQGTFKTVCYVFPFANMIDIGQKIIGVNVENILLKISISVFYLLAICAISVFVFYRKLKEDSI